jgi:hypothetical protein
MKYNMPDLRFIQSLAETQAINPNPIKTSIVCLILNPCAF